MVCAMLGCGKVEAFTFDTPFTHTNGTRWFYQCRDENEILWDCNEIDATRAHVCQGPKAAGVICNSK